MNISGFYREHLHAPLCALGLMAGWSIVLVGNAMWQLRDYVPPARPEVVTPVIVAEPAVAQVEQKRAPQQEGLHD